MNGCITKEKQLAEIKERCEAATLGKWHVQDDWGVKTIPGKGSYWKQINGDNPEQSVKDAVFIANAKSDISILLYVIETEMKRADEAENAVTALFEDPDILYRAMSRICNERDRWKARAEALERAVKAYLYMCEICLQKDCENCEKFNNWRFDEVRFGDNSYST